MENRERPNVIIVLTDDQGYGDIARHGNPVVRTPHLDALHDESVRLRDFHVDPSCSPTRSAIMTGCYAHRVNVWNTTSGRNHMQKDAITMAEVFRSNGYRTGHFGKWHLGGNYPYRPMDRGFDEWLGQGDGGTGTANDYWGNVRVNDVYIRNGGRERIEGFAADVFFEEAMDFVRERRKKPFFLYLATYIPHTPCTVPDRSWVDPYRDEVPIHTAYFYAAVERADYNVGRLRAFLQAEGLAENTLLIFMTDNGTTSGSEQVFNAGMRGTKLSIYDGGHRVPCFFHWPGGGLTHSRDVEPITAHVDLLPTLIDLCGLDTADIDLDGISLKPLLYGTPTDWPERTLVVESQRIRDPEKWRNCSVMTSRWRLVNGGELYDMPSDPGQQRDVSVEHPDVVETLRGAYEAFWTRVTHGDEELARPCLGTSVQDEIFLSSIDWVAEESERPWNQGHVAAGLDGFGVWHAHIGKAGRYQLEVRRWPREIDLPMTAVPELRENPEAYLMDEPVMGTIYGDTFAGLPVARVRLKVGDDVQETALEADATCATFEVQLDAGPIDVRTFLLDENGKKLCGGYFTYVKRIG